MDRKQAGVAPKTSQSARKKSARIRNGSAPKLKLRLYIAGQTPRSLAALENLKRIADEHFSTQYDIEVIDLLQNPTLARGDQILAVPTLVRNIPKPIRKIIGDLSNTEHVLVGLDIKEAAAEIARRS